MIRGSVGGVLVMCLALSGCSGQVSELPVTASASTSQAAHFETDAAAVAAARKVYVSYLKASQKVSESGGGRVELIADFVTKSEYAAEEKSAAYLRSKKLKAIGGTKLLAFRLQRANLQSGAVTAYACVDLSKVRVVDTAGKNVTPETRPNRQTSIPHFEWQSGRLVISEDESWSGESIC